VLEFRYPWAVIDYVEGKGPKVQIQPVEFGSSGENDRWAESHL
jgi:hypothetical protein